MEVVAADAAGGVWLTAVWVTAWGELEALPDVPPQPVRASADVSIASAHSTVAGPVIRVMSIPVALALECVTGASGLHGFRAQRALAGNTGV